MTDICEAVEETCAGALSRGACEDSVFEGFRFQTATGAGAIGLWGPPGRVRCQVPFPGSHLVDSPSHEIPQAHEGARVKGWEVVFVGGGGGTVGTSP